MMNPGPGMLPTRALDSLRRAHSTGYLFKKKVRLA
jgi:hypothetical protein